LISNSCVDLVSNCKIGVIALMDHATVELHINLKVEKNCKGRWRLNSSILQDEQFVSTLKEDIKDVLEINVRSANRLATVWDALNAFVRGKCFALRQSLESMESVAKSSRFHGNQAHARKN